MLTPEDIFEKEFSRSIRGYDVDQVNEFLDQIISDFSRLLDENKNLKEENQKLKQSVGRQGHHTKVGAPENQNTQDLVKRIEQLERKMRIYNP